MTEVETRDPGLGTGALIAFIAAFVVVGAPMVYYLWTTVNNLLAGHFEAVRLLGTLGTLLLFAGVLVILARFVRRL